MFVGGAYFVGVIQLLNHTLPFRKTMVGNDGLFFIIPLQVHGHAGSVCFRMKLCANHIFIKTNGHQRPFIRHMRPFFFDAKNAGTHLLETVAVGLYHLEIAAVNRKKKGHAALQIPVLFLHPATHVWGKTPKAVEFLLVTCAIL